MTPTRAVVLASALWGTVVSAGDITACGQLVRPGEVGELRRDLDCRSSGLFSSDGYGVILDHGATVNLSGHTLRGDGTQAGIGCYAQSETPADAPCTVNGPGEITGFWAGMNGAGCTLVARDVAVRANTNGIVAPLVCTVQLSGVTVTDNQGDGVWAWEIEAQDVETSRNAGFGLIATNRLDAVRLRAIGNGRTGVTQNSTYRESSARLEDSVVTGSGGRFDIAWVGQLRLEGTVCGRAVKVRYRRVRNADDYRLRVVRRVACARR